MHTQPSAMLQDALYVFTSLLFPVCQKGSRDGESSCFWPAEQQSILYYDDFFFFTIEDLNMLDLMKKSHNGPLAKDYKYIRTQTYI